MAESFNNDRMLLEGQVKQHLTSLGLGDVVELPIFDEAIANTSGAGCSDVLLLRRDVAGGAIKQVMYGVDVRHLLISEILGLPIERAHKLVHCDRYGPVTPKDGTARLGRLCSILSRFKK